ncbi:FMN reductase [Saccharopolyspora erythraea NRRL 2338]|uniref:NADPH-dependent FMN reductase family protein n=2 Tax=Saccharopolyspora erythraea TaxID=1836 RepID=A4F6G3_SACEN|nr:NAD(P)H-dependent oxidoreductase [Saccharopolyspora erythraea]EQD88092.1 FMN reductase [Saccharopolyspora erythraea D]PFG93440.1 FMN reductase [Saccharopolyspora erythraea NRRL 2338]QRK90313.1 NAD(P)H-dependent oxidoreductase [Saccharopolyspora erythraea]CAL99637.1 NADPH-dependent FMN reductase family protein [Saccharopolyspora erythraea NRRL 2338]
MTLTVVGIGGSVRPDSQSERAMRAALAGARDAGAKVRAITGSDLALPFYDPQVPERTENAIELVEALRTADGVVISSPGYHGTISGLIKNALDYVEDLRGDERVYLDGRAVGCIGVAYGWQATVTTLQALRSVVHSLRGWPTPLGAAVNSAETQLGPEGESEDEKVTRTLRTIGQQVVDFANSRR